MCATWIWTLKSNHKNCCNIERVRRIGYLLGIAETWWPKIHGPEYFIPRSSHHSWALLGSLFSDMGLVLRTFPPTFSSKSLFLWPKELFFFLFLRVGVCQDECLCCIVLDRFFTGYVAIVFCIFYLRHIKFYFFIPDYNLYLLYPWLSGISMKFLFWLNKKEHAPWHPFIMWTI